LALEMLIAVKSETLMLGKRSEAENFLVLETRTTLRGEQRERLTSGDAPRNMRQGSLRVSKTLEASIKDRMHVSSF
jgi:hypothetical protein